MKEEQSVLNKYNGRVYYLTNPDNIDELEIFCKDCEVYLPVQVDQWEQETRICKFAVVIYDDVYEQFNKKMKN